MTQAANAIASRRPSDSPALWLVLLAGSFLLHGVFFLVLGPLLNRPAGSAGDGGGPIAVELIDTPNSDPAAPPAIAAAKPVPVQPAAPVPADTTPVLPTAPKPAQTTPTAPEPVQSPRPAPRSQPSPLPATPPTRSRDRQPDPLPLQKPTATAPPPITQPKPSPKPSPSPSPTQGPRTSGIGLPVPLPISGTINRGTSPPDPTVNPGTIEPPGQTETGANGFKLTIDQILDDNGGKDIPDERGLRRLMKLEPFKTVPSPCLRRYFGQQQDLRIVIDRNGFPRKISPTVCPDLEKQLGTLNLGMDTQDGQPVERQVRLLLRVDPL